MVLVEFLLVFVTTIVAVIAYYKKSFTYWERKNMPFFQPTIPQGNLESFVRRTKSIGYRYKDIYDQFKTQGVKHAGIYILSTPAYMPLEPELIKSIMVRDFENFDDRGLYSNEKDDPLSANLFCIGNPRWKVLRSKLSPTFTSGKMKMMFHTIIQCGKQMTDVLDNFCDNKEPFDVKEMMACFTTDVISSCAFGLECNSCKNPDEEFRVYGKTFMNFTRPQALKNVLSLTFPNISRAFGVRLIREDVANYFLNAVKSTVEYREKNNYVRKDFMQLLIDMKNNNNNIKSSDLDNMSLNELAAYAFAFYIGGFETSSTTLMFALYGMSLNQNIQDKARDEVREVLSKYNGEITYESLSEMKYIEQIVDETLRKYPVLPLLTRKCVKDYNIPGTDIILEAGTSVFISTLGLHHDPEYFPEPEKFDPERFNEQNKNQIHPFTYLPFGEGPRICIGLRFGMMQTKIGLAILLNKYKISINDKTEQPIKYHLYGFTTSLASEIYLNVDTV